MFTGFATYDLWPHVLHVHTLIPKKEINIHIFSNILCQREWVNEWIGAWGLTSNLTFFLSNDDNFHRILHLVQRHLNELPKASKPPHPQHYTKVRASQSLHFHSMLNTKRGGYDTLFYSLRCYSTRIYHENTAPRADNLPTVLSCPVISSMITYIYAGISHK